MENEPPSGTISSDPIWTPATTLKLVAQIVGLLTVVANIATAAYLGVGLLFVPFEYTVRFPGSLPLALLWATSMAVGIYLLRGAPHLVGIAYPHTRPPSQKPKRRWFRPNSLSRKRARSRKRALRRASSVAEA